MIHISRVSAFWAGIMIANVCSATAALSQTSAINAPGRVEGAGPTLTIGAAAEAIVDEILVREGDHVAAGQVLIKLDCQSNEAEVRARVAQLEAAQAALDRAYNGSRPDEIAVGKAVVGYSQARSEEAQKTLDRTEALKEGITVTTAHILEVQRDARIAAAQLEEAKARLSLLQAGSREEDVRQAKALRDATARKSEPRLLFQEWMLIRHADAQFMLAATRHHRIEHAPGVRKLYRPVSDAALLRRHFKHRLKPMHAARAVANDVDYDLALGCQSSDRRSNLIRAASYRDGVAGNVDTKRAHRSVSATRASSFLSSRRPTVRPSIIADGDTEHRPRQ